MLGFDTLAVTAMILIALREAWIAMRRRRAEAQERIEA